MTEVATPPAVNGAEGTASDPPKAAESTSTPDINGATTTETPKVNDDGAATEAATPATNGGPAKAKKESEPPKDPKEDTLGWLKQQRNAAIHKVNFHVLDWLQKTAIDEETKRPALPLKGKEEAITRGQFQAHLKDGQLLAHLANKFSPGSVETVHEGDAAKEKANQTANLQAFIIFAKEKVGLADDQVFSVEDLQERGKAGYEAVINTLFQLGFRAQEKFNQTGLELDYLVDEVKKVVDPSFFQKFAQVVQNGISALTLKFARNPQTPTNTNGTAQPAENGTNGTTANGTTTQPTENGDKPAEGTTVTEEPKKMETSEPVAAQ